MSSNFPPKWTVLKIWCAHLAQPHNKFCIVIDAKKGWFFFINSDPPAFRKAKNLAVEIGNFEAHFLSHTSYIDTTTFEELSEVSVNSAIKDPDRNMGLLIKSVQKKIKDMVSSHHVLPPEPREIVLDDN
ncbi:hypothetical protein [Asticcacaulis machinosus]|uniref:Uncharacterized protein n=1 Tax=Asticcacaulis machinosus TaxID=2984211 RepID=A0ABT5HKS4_9CAUL|nr:hypothetical protein [Asticcacaulis machinosus]MDC7676846.1 hypothetical protein [Asticcacaulis machinosus]